MLVTITQEMSLSVSTISMLVTITYHLNWCDNYLLVIDPGILGMLPATSLGQAS